MCVCLFVRVCSCSCVFDLCPLFVRLRVWSCVVVCWGGCVVCTPCVVCLFCVACLYVMFVFVCLLRLFGCVVCSFACMFACMRVGIFACVRLFVAFVPFLVRLLVCLVVCV